MGGKVLQLEEMAPDEAGPPGFVEHRPRGTVPGSATGQWIGVVHADSFECSEENAVVAGVFRDAR
ncbi:hypothetical protein [Amycolatopsis ultiminotia]